MKTYIWDLDGTLVDSYKIIVEHIKTVFKDYTDYSNEDIFDKITATSVSDFFIQESAKLGLDIKKLYLAYKSLTTSVDGNSYDLISNAEEVLHALKTKGATHYIYTHRGISTLNILEANGIDLYFTEVITSEHGFKRKPDGDALNYLIKKYKLNTEHTYYVGDRHLDVLCGIDAGVSTIYYNEKGLLHKQATHSVKDLIEILEL